MSPKIIKKEAIILAGVSFFGNPFETKDPWSEENEIGKLWHRFMVFMQQNTSDLSQIMAHKDVFYEVHITHPNTNVTGEFEVFIGTAIIQTKNLPVELVIKVLPPTKYAIFTIEGQEIDSDWHHWIYQDWLPQADYVAAYPFNFQYYDHRFKGLDKLAESAIDVYVPVK